MRVDVDALNENLRTHGALRLRHAMRPDEAFGIVLNFDGGAERAGLPAASPPALTAHDTAASFACVVARLSPLSRARPRSAAFQQRVAALPPPGPLDSSLAQGSSRT
jgi:hypothetical protein